MFGAIRAAAAVILGDRPAAKPIVVIALRPSALARLQRKQAHAAGGTGRTWHWARAGDTGCADGTRRDFVSSRNIDAG